MILHFGQFIGHETLSREFKAFTLPSALLEPFGEKLLPLAHSGKWQFNHLVYRTLSSYFMQFHDKYGDAFQSLDNKNGDGELWIGVDDRGIIHGIPVQGTLDMDLIRSYCPSPDTKIDLFPVSFDREKYSIHLPSTNPRITKFLREFTSTNTLFEARNANYRRWRSEFDTYTRKLVELYRDPLTKNEFMEWLRTYSPETHDSILSTHDFTVEQKKYHEIREYVQRKEGVYYWMCKWKDERLSEIRSRKPRKFSLKQRHRSTRYGPKQILSNVTGMIPYWFDRNVGMNLYVMRWTFPKTGNPCPTSFKRSLIVRHGVVTPEPCCIRV